MTSSLLPNRSWFSEGKHGNDDEEDSISECSTNSQSGLDPFPKSLYENILSFFDKEGLYIVSQSPIFTFAKLRPVMNLGRMNSLLALTPSVSVDSERNLTSNLFLASWRKELFQLDFSQTLKSFYKLKRFVS